MTIVFTNPERWGYIPHFLKADDPRPAAAQINEHYAFGGGWRPNRKFKLTRNGDRYVACYPMDPPFREVGRAQLREETIVLFESDYVGIIQPDRSYEIARVD